MSEIVRRVVQWKQGSALLIILAFVTLITVLVVSLLLFTKYERTAASLALGRTQAEVLAGYGVDIAMERLRESIDEGRVFNPGSSYTTWASEPGRVHVFTVGSGGAISRVARDMFSAPPGPDATGGNVDLNKADLSDRHAITGDATGTATGTMKVGWVNLLANPGEVASKSNPAVGRIAYWVDDESCKVNINIADGSKKATDQSFGFGTPSEINLQAFGISNAIAASIATFAATDGFNSAAEISRVSGIPADFYQLNKFSLTHTSRTPELNMFGEPRIYLFPVQKFDALATYSNMGVGGYGNYSDWTSASAAPNNVPIATSSNSAAIYNNISGAIDFIYPITPMLPTMSATAVGRNQLPTMPVTLGASTIALPLAQNLVSWSSVGAQGTNANSGLTNFPLGMRIAKYLQGYNSQNQSFSWPQFPNATVSGFTGKYNTRQLDSIALQIVDLASAKNVMADQSRIFSQPNYMVRGFLNAASTTPSLVWGVGRSPKVNEIQLRAEGSIVSNISTLKLEIMMETYFPKYYSGAPYVSYVSDFQFDTDGGVHIPHSFNQQDKPYWKNAYGGTADYKDPGTGQSNPYGDATAATPMDKTPISMMGSYWGNKMLAVEGIDFIGWPSNNEDQQGRSGVQGNTQPSTYHPYTMDPLEGYYAGSNNETTFRTTLLGMSGPAGSVSATSPWSPGEYRASPNTYGQYLRRGKKPASTQFAFSGGLALWTRTGSGNGTLWEVAPVDSMRGYFTGETTARSGNFPEIVYSNYGMISDTTVQEVVKKAVIPVNFSLNVPGSATYSVQVSDPLVNKFPKDWTATTGSANGTIPAWNGGYNVLSYQEGANATYGDNTYYKPSNGGDPLSVWLSPQLTTIPKQARFPSVSALNYVRTGMIPDDLTLTVDQQGGTPWRSISFGPTTAQGQGTARGIFPDWAMLDLFTVPFLPQLPYSVNNVSGSGTATLMRKFTSGGSTEGRLNINNPLTPYPFSQSYSGVAQTPPQRSLPLQALFYGMKLEAYSGNTVTSDSVTVSSAVASIQDYLNQASTPVFMMPGQLAEVPGISSYAYTAGVSPKQVQSRNEIMKNVMGSITTQSNTYSIWVVAQTFKKSPRNTNYGQFEPGDTVTGELRRRYIVERFIETGSDAVPGNASNPGADTIVGTADDPIDPSYHPVFNYPLPYRWRIRATDDVIL